MAREVSKDSRIKGLEENLRAQGEATRRYHQMVGERDNKIDRMDLENENLHRELKKAKQWAEQAQNRLVANHEYVERARYAREIIGNELNKLQHRIGRQRESNRAMHRELKELRDIVHKNSEEDS